jgi:hypothetical protein
MPRAQTARTQAATTSHSRRGDPLRGSFSAAGWSFADTDAEHSPGRIFTRVLGGSHGRLTEAVEDAAMTTTTALILNSVLILALLVVVASVMRLGHRAAGSSARPAQAFGRLELERLPADGRSHELERAA